MKKIILTALLLALLFTGCTNGNSENSGDDTQSTEATQATVAETTTTKKDIFEIKTKYCTLKFPSKWNKKVTTEVEDADTCIVHFKAAKTDTPLFDLIFGEAKAYQVGYLETEDGRVAVRIKSYEIEEDDPNFAEYCAIQDDVNIILNTLSSDYDFVMGV